MRSRTDILLVAAIAILYVAFLTQSYFWDGVLFSYHIEQVHAGRQAAATLFQPNHLLYAAFGYVLYAGTQMLHITKRAITLLQVVNCLISVLIAGYLYRWFVRRVSPAAALAGTLLFAFGATWWKYSTDCDSYIIACALFVVAVLFALEDRPRLVAAGACHAAAMLFHELAIFAYFPILVAIALRTERPIRRLLAYVAGTAAFVCAVYVICFRYAGGGSSAFLKWITTYASDTTITRTPGQLVTEYVTSYGKLFGGGKFSAVRDHFSVWTAAGLLMLLAGLLVASRFKKAVVLNELTRNSQLVLWSWVGPLAVFSAWFDPGNAAHKLFLWPAIVLLLVTSRWAQRWIGLLVGLAIALAGWNLAGYIYPHSLPDGDPVVAFAYRLAGELPPNAHVYYAAFSPDDWYLAYFAPDTSWEPVNPRPEHPACYETTALQSLAPPHVTRTWTLVAKGRNVHVGCVWP